ncbi:hypothetical protein Tco_0163957 [Tanacetum coccineum]
MSVPVMFSTLELGLVYLFETAVIIITEYLVNISKRRAFWSLNEDILKINILTINMSYPSRKIRHIRACTHQRPQRKPVQYIVSNEYQYAVLEVIDDNAEMSIYDFMTLPSWGNVKVAE